jgi:hypothetical protein
MPRAFWMAYANNHRDLLRYFEDELDALHRGNGAAARTANTGRADAMGQIMLAELVRRGVLPAAHPRSDAF